MKEISGTVDYQSGVWDKMDPIKLSVYIHSENFHSLKPAPRIRSETKA